MLLLILRLSTLKQAPIHILCSIYIYILFMLYFIYAHTQTNLPTLKQAPIHILCSIYIYYFSFLLLVKHIHTETNLQKLKQARFTYCATKYFIFKHILISACTLVFKRSIKIYFQIFDAKKRKNDSSRELLGRKNQ